MKPVFCFSLDVELEVGFDTWKWKRSFNEEKERKTLDNFFSLCSKYEIPTTIAFCGHLFLNDCKCHDKSRKVFAPELIERAKSEGHEVACHSFSHPSFQEISTQNAQEELVNSVKAAKDFNLKLDTFIYPGNRIEHTHLLPEHGFKFFTTEIKNQSFFKPNFLNPKTNNDLVEVPRTLYLEQTILKHRLKMDYFLLHSNLNKNFFHLWCHPFNLFSKQQLALLEKAFKFVKKNDFEVKRINELNFF